MSTPSNAYKTYRAAVKAAVEFDNPNWTSTAITQERARLLQAAQAALTAAKPAEPTTVGSSKRADALAKLRPSNADTVAVALNEWSKVQILIESGRSLYQVLRDADRARLTGILDQYPTALAIHSIAPEDAVKEVEAMVLDRLADLGDDLAVQAKAEGQEQGQAAAWRAVIDETIQRGEPTVASLSQLHAASPEEYRATEWDDDVDAYQVLRRIGQLNNANSEGQAQ